MDDADNASEMFLKAAISTCKKPEGPKYCTGFCFNCDAPLRPGERFCDRHCAEDYEKFGPIDLGGE